MRKSPETTWAIFKVTYDEFPVEVWPDMEWGIPGVHYTDASIPPEHLELVEYYEIRVPEAEERYRRELKGGGKPISWQDVQIGDIVNIKTWMIRRSHLVRYKVVGKPDAPGYEGLIIEKPEGGSQMHIPGVTITKIEVIG